MSGLADEVGEALSQFESKRVTADPYFFFEPWDCDIPDPDVMRSALADGVDLVEDPAVQLAGEYPRVFQTGSINSTKKMVVTQAGSRSGKSICTQVVIASMVSRQPPYAFRYDKGEDTGIEREINPGNINRGDSNRVRIKRVVSTVKKHRAPGISNSHKKRRLKID